LCKEDTIPAHKKHPTTTPRREATPTVVAPAQLQAENFHQYLRVEIRAATPVVMEEIMREELSQFLGAAWGESTPQRKGYRNGFYSRGLMTTSGPLEDLKVPRDREGAFHTQALSTTTVMNPRLPMV
jgi:putative transposase